MVNAGAKIPAFPDGVEGGCPWRAAVPSRLATRKHGARGRAPPGRHLPGTFMNNVG